MFYSVILRNLENQIAGISNEHGRSGELVLISGGVHYQPSDKIDGQELYITRTADRVPDDTPPGKIGELLEAIDRWNDAIPRPVYDDLIERTLGGAK